MVRWYNIFFLALAQYLAVVFILNDASSFRETLSNPDLHLIVFASLFCVAGGYIINNFYDLEKDLINRPNKTVYEKIVKQTTGLRLYFLFNLIGALLGLSVSFNVFLFFSVYIFALWIYSHKLKKITFVGNMVASILSIIPFFAIFIYYHLADWLVVVYVSFILLIIFLREIIKDLEALKGDVIVGYPTLPVRWGVSVTKWIIALFAASGVLPTWYVLKYSTGSGIWYFMLSSMIVLASSLLFLVFAKEKRHYRGLNYVFRLMIISGILSLIWLS